MAANDIKVLSANGLAQLPCLTFKTSAGEVAINPGEPVAFNVPTLNAATSDYVIAMTDGKPVVATDYMVGIAKSTGTHTSSANGTVDVYLATPGVIFRCKAKSSTAADTQGEIDDLVGKRVLLDLTAGTYTVDTAEAPALVNGIIIVGGNPLNNEVDFMVAPRATFFGN